ncbi:MAG: response regulator [Aphanocapsa sp. GSE-SYN-MK-11-07L]|jgi:PAS domain S-box-containing protein|nr:response regulator [Aphanocapsa sp. GSE-SYN-MK-11-07L]
MRQPKGDILVIDDTPENLQLLATLLTTQGYKVRSVTKGSTGCRAAQAAPPDLILLDVNMPEMNGYEVCQHLKADSQTQDIPVIFISAHEDVLDKVKAFAIGGVDYITKPFQVEEVLARVEHHLTIQRLQRQLQNQNQRLQQEVQERELALQALQQAEEKFAKAFRSSPNPIAITTLAEGRFIDANANFLRITGYPLAELIGQTVLELDTGLDRIAYAKAIADLQTTGVVHNQEFEFRTKTGQTRTVLLSIEQIELAGVPCALNIANDITERKQLENEFISLVSHELRTPLTSLMGALDLLATGQLGSLTPQGQRVLEIATNSTERLIRLINDILDLERIKAGKISLQKVDCNAAELITQAGEAMQGMATQAKISLAIEPMAVTLNADPDCILQTLTNLLSNAIKFSEPGGIVRLSAELTSEWLHLQVQDHGRGIPTDKLHSIFERFQQVDASDSRKKGGTGLGLAICRSIVNLHGGKIWVESVLSQGSTFHIQLPLNLEEP